MEIPCGYCYLVLNVLAVVDSYQFCEDEFGGRAIYMVDGKTLEVVDKRKLEAMI
jgi:hypothetical protein